MSFRKVLPVKPKPPAKRRPKPRKPVKHHK